MATGSLIIEGNIRLPSDIYDLRGFRRWVHSDSFPERGDFAYDSRDLGEILADGALLVNEAAGLSTEPDMTFCSWDRLQVRGDGTWRDTEPDSDGLYQSDVLGGRFRLVRELNRVGGFRYELLSKSL